jgi:glycosyltransferase involved in cell wall biosynthesis
VFNEESTLASLLDAVETQAGLVAEIVIVDDASTDATAQVLESHTPKIPTTIVRHPKNKGKGAAIRTGIHHATCDYLLIQDADLEYSPDDYGKLLDPVIQGRAQVVYGTRSFGGHAAFSFWFVMGNKMVTLATNVLFNAYITDMETCFKLLPVRMWRGLDLRANRFGVEPEVTGKLLSSGERIFEVPISYNARTRTEGKKLTWTDGLKALGVLLAVRTGTWDKISKRGM